jgi:hypothetical protein
MKRLKSIVLSSVAIATGAMLMSGCSALQETLASQMEVPTLENQANRVAIGMTIVRENNILAFKMPISADAQWPALVSADINDTQKMFIQKALQDEPYYATMHYTKMIQRNMLGSGALMNQFGDAGNLVAMVADQSVSPLTYRALNKLDILFANPKLKAFDSYPSEEKYLQARMKNWPNIFNFDSSLDNFLEFKDGKLRLVEAVSGDAYPTIGDAVISLAPTNMKKDLTSAQTEMLEAFVDVAVVTAKKGELETKLKTDVAQQENKEKNPEYVALSAQEKLDIEQEIATVEAEIKVAEATAEEKEKIYFQLLDEAVVALESEINVDDEAYVNLAKNLNIVANEIQISATEAYTAFGMAASNILANNIVLQFPKELESLAIAKVSVPMNLQDKYNQRIERLVKNAVYLLPNVFIGTYYANKQATLAEKYESVTNIILLAYETKKEQDAAAAKAAEEEAAAAAQASAAK